MSAPSIHPKLASLQPSLNAMQLEVRDRVAYLTFTRPDSLNSITPQFTEDFETVLTYLEADVDCRALVLTGTGKAFCVGQDIAIIQRGFSELPFFEAVVRRLHNILFRLEALTLPTIAAVNGYARAGGWEILLCCDFVLVAREAKVGDAHSTYAVAPGGGASQRLPRIVGMQRAKELIWTGRWMSAEEMVSYGLALSAPALADLPAAVEDLLTGIRDKPRKLLAVTKQMLRLGQDVTVQEGIEIEFKLFFEYMRDSPDPVEGVRAWLEKRPPVWS